MTVREKNLVRSIRFSEEQYAAIQAKSQELGIEFSVFVRMAALRAVGGLHKDEIDKVRRRAEVLQAVGR